MLNQKALDYIFDVNIKIDAKLSRLNQKIDAKLSRHFRDMERVYAVIARAAAKRRQWEEQGPYVYLQPRCTPWRTTWNGTASIGPGDSITESTQPSKQKPRPRIGFRKWEEGWYGECQNLRSTASQLAASKST